MYLGQAGSRPKAPLARVPGTVVALGTVSLLTDVSSEMVTAFLPLYLVYSLQMGYAQFGFLDGLYTGATAVLRLVGGYFADRWRRQRLVAGVGYGLSALTRVGLLAAGTSALGISVMVAADRAGKGLRTAPRDALIAQAVAPERRGAAFGVHRTMDTAGALIGPLVTFLLLMQLGTAPQPVFVVSFCFAVLGLLVLAGYGPRRSEAPAEPRTRPSPLTVSGLVSRGPLLRVAVVAALLGFVTLSDAFLYLLLQRSAGLPLAALPLLPLGTAGAFLLLATPAGRLADRLGRGRVFVGGHVLFLGAYAVVLSGAPGIGAAVAALALHGAFYAATDGVLSAWIAEHVPETAQASGLAVVQTAQALARFGSSVTAGILLAAVGFGVTGAVAAAALALALCAAAAVLRMRRS